MEKQLSSYYFDLPKALIAQHPCVERVNSKLLIYDQESGEIKEDIFANLGAHITAGSIIKNQSKVFPGRVLGKKKTGGQCEVLFLSLEKENNSYKCMIKTSGKKRIGDKFYLGSSEEEFEIIKILSGQFLISSTNRNLILKEFLQEAGVMPLPPYIERVAQKEFDTERYQTVYANDSQTGSIAAPTAGLHFDEKLISKLEEQGNNFFPLTLHVGPGTFQPVKADNILDHQMHHEVYSLPKKTKEHLVNWPKPLYAVGTTSLRVLETIYRKGGVENFSNDEYYSTDIFLNPLVKPSFCIDGLITNFHLPGSTLFMLICHLIGIDEAKKVYQYAVDQEFRFFSYGDACLFKLKRNHEF